MKEIDLTNAELFENLLEISLEGFYIDLHNDYDCINIYYNNTNLQLTFEFKRIETEKSTSSITIKFENTLFSKIDLSFQNIPGNLTLDNFYRGRFEQNEVLREYSDEGKGYFYLEFSEGGSFELFSNDVRLFMNSEQQ